MCEPLREKATFEAELYGFTFNDVKSAVEFYKRYRYHIKRLDEEHEELYIIYNNLCMEEIKTSEFVNTKYNDWLFDYCFGDVI